MRMPLRLVDTSDHFDRFSAVASGISDLVNLDVGIGIRALVLHFFFLSMQLWKVSFQLNYCFH